MVEGDAETEHNILADQSKWNTDQTDSADGHGPDICRNLIGSDPLHPSNRCSIWKFGYALDSSIWDKCSLQSKPLHPVVVGIEDVHSPTGVAGDAPGLVELALAAAVNPPHSDEVTIEREFLHAVIAELAEVHVAVRRTCKARLIEQDVVGIVKLPRIVSVLAPALDQPRLGAASVEHLHAVVAGVGDPEESRAVDGHLLWPEELAQLLAVAAPLEQEVVVGGEFLDAVVFAVFGDVEVTSGVLHAISYRMELARPGSPRAAERAVGQELALRRVGQDTVVVGVGDEQVALVIE